MTKIEAKTTTAMDPTTLNEDETAPFWAGPGASVGEPSFVDGESEGDAEIDDGDEAGASEATGDGYGGDVTSVVDGVGAVAGVVAVTAAGARAGAAVVVGDWAGEGDIFLGICTEGEGAGDWATVETTSNAAIAATKAKLTRAIYM